jgi:DnaJ-class molecular chaperone
MNHYRGDVSYEVWITPEEASVGTQRTFAFHTAQGCLRTVTICVPAGVRNGDFVLVPCEGGPSATGERYGDFYAAIRIGMEPLPGASGHLSPDLAVAAALDRGWPMQEEPSAPLRQWLWRLWRSGE